MTRKIWTLVALAALLGGFSLYLNRDWFGREDIHIFHRARPGRNGDEVLMFGFDHKMKLTALKIIAVPELETNKHPHAAWQLVSESNSVPVQDFVYGMNIRGMHPTLKGVTADALEPGIPYRLFVQSGSVKGQHDFSISPPAPE